MNQKEIIHQFRESLPAEEQMGLVFGACKIAVRANEKAIIESLEEYYQPFLTDPENADILITVHEAPTPEIRTADGLLSFTIKQPDPGKTKIKEEYADIPGGRIVRKRLTGMIFAFGDADHLGIAPCLENINQVVNFINNRYIQWKLCRGCLLGHAARIIWKGRGMAMAGFSGAGKSTLALHMMSRGASFVSNDRLMIEKNGNGLVMHGVAKLPRINPGTILNNENLIGIMTPEDRERFSALSKEELWDLEHKYDAPIEECFGPG